MTVSVLAAIALPLALQGAAAAAQPAPPPQSLADLSVIEATAPRCGIAFAVVEGWQGADDPRGRAYPPMASNGGREFFVVAMARLMDARSLTREDVMRMVALELDRHKADDYAAIDAMMPACLALLQSSGIEGG